MPQVIIGAIVTAVTSIGSIAGVAIGLVATSLVGKLLGPKAPKIPQANKDRLYSTIDPSTPRKIAFGKTALAADIRYEEWNGTNQEYLDRIIAVASHKVQAIEEIWLEDKQAWTSSGGVTSTYSGYLTVTTRTEGNSGNTISINGGAKWGSTRRLTGIAYIHMRFKTTGNSKKATSPFSSSIPQRITIRGKGALVYDPRLDSTQGGSGSHRADDQTTWAWVSDDVGGNPVLQVLFYLLGWKIGGKLAVGRGIPPSRIDLASFIAAANLCDENVTLALGGTEKRYRSAGVVSEADTATSVLETLLAACAGTLRDAGGRLAISILYNDLASPVADFTDDDVIDGFDWQQTTDIAPNAIRGRYTDASDNALYQMVDYPAPTPLTSPDGIERVHTLDLAFVQSSGQAQRLAKQELQRAQYSGVFRADFRITAWRCRVGDPVRLTLSTLAFSSKLFRVTAQTIRMDGTCELVLREENSAIYSWSAEDVAAVSPTAPTVYDPLNAPLVKGIEEASLAGFAASHVWDFTNSAQGWTASQITVTTNSTYVHLDSTGTAPSWTSPAVVVNGGYSTLLRARVRRTAGTGWTGKARFDNGSHSYSSSYEKTIADATVLNEWVVLEWDMASLTVGGADWTGSSAIVGLRLLLGASAADEFDVDWIAVGKAAVAYSSNAIVTNRVPLSRFENGWPGVWVERADTSAIATIDTASPYSLNGKNYLRVDFTSSGASQSFDLGMADGSAFRVTPGEQLNVQIEAGGPALTTIALKARFLDSAGATVSTVTVASLVAPSISSTDLTRISGVVEVPASSASAVLFVTATTGPTSPLVGHLKLAEPLAAPAVPGQGEPPPFVPGASNEPGADVTTVITGPESVAVSVDSSGTVTTALPSLTQYRLYRDGLDVTDDADWSVSALVGTMAVDIDTAGDTYPGLFSLDTSGGTITAGLVRISATYSGITRDVQVRVMIDQVPGAGSGSGGGTYAEAAIEGEVNSTSMMDVTASIDITVGTGGQADLTATYTFNPAGALRIYTQWFRWNGSSWVSVQSEVQCNVDAQTSPQLYPGSGVNNVSVTGLTASSAQSFKLQARCHSTTSVYIATHSLATATGS